MSTITSIQRLLCVSQDGIWGPRSQAALQFQIESTARSSEMLIEIQRLLGVTPDGIWGPHSQAALNIEIGSVPGFSCEASSFADPADIASFRRCKTTGKTDLQCFAVGDNGIGQFGRITSQEMIPMVAVHGDAMKAKWGSIAGAAHRPVEVTVRGITIRATVEDRMSATGRIDLNPACAKRLGLNPPFVVPCSWRWLA